VRPLPLQGERSHKPLDLGALLDFPALLVGEGARDDVFAHVVTPAKVEECADLVGALWPETAGDRFVSESWDFSLAPSDDYKIKYGNVVSNYGATDALALPLSSPPGPVGLLSLSTKDSYTSVGEDALTHRESLLVISTRDTEGITGEFRAEDTPLNLLGDAVSVEVLELDLIFDFDELLLPGGRTRNIDLKTRDDRRSDRKKMSTKLKDRMIKK